MLLGNSGIRSEGDATTGYHSRKMREEHKGIPVLVPVTLCGEQGREKDRTAFKIVVDHAPVSWAAIYLSAYYG